MSSDEWWRCWCCKQEATLAVTENTSEWMNGWLVGCMDDRRHFLRCVAFAQETQVWPSIGTTQITRICQFFLDFCYLNSFFVLCRFVFLFEILFDFVACLRPSSPLAVLCLRTCVWMYIHFFGPPEDCCTQSRAGVLLVMKISENERCCWALFSLELLILAAKKEKQKNPNKKGK